MKTYIGTKIIKAAPMKRAEYNEYRGWTLPANENGVDEGFLVEYLDGGEANDKRHAGYISWSPVIPFSKTYRAMQGLTFGLALEALKKGLKVARSGWNGKGMWLALSPGVTALSADEFWARPNLAYAAEHGGTADVLPCITMKTATGEILMGWLASQTDMLAEDWEILE
jgi:hypothetical protein